jgi:hypothetical protein
VLKVIEAAALPKVVVAIGSYVAGIYAPLIPYSAITEPVDQVLFIETDIDVIAEVDNHKPLYSATYPLPFASYPEKPLAVLYLVVDA